MIRFLTGVRGFCYGQYNELDTPKWPISGQYLQNICEGLEWLVGEFRVVNTSHTTSIRFNWCKDLIQNNNSKIMLLRDLTASFTSLAFRGDLAKMRGRSFHSNCTLNRFKVESFERTMKGNILELKSQETGVLESNISAQAPYYYKVRPTDFFITLVRKELQLYKNQQQNVYNGLINILRKPEFLVACCQEIYGNTPLSLTPQPDFSFFFMKKEKYREGD